MALALPKSKLYEANAQSTNIWQVDLKKLFHHAKERYADVVWEVTAEGETDGEEVYGHKGEHNRLQPPVMMTTIRTCCISKVFLYSGLLADSCL
jgi:hypothetical protein